jgi:hypothetical protein
VQVFFLGAKRPGVKLTGHFHLVQGLERSGVVMFAPPTRVFLHGVDSDNLPLKLAVNIFIQQFCTENHIWKQVKVSHG